MWSLRFVTVSSTAGQHLRCCGNCVVRIGGFAATWSISRKYTEARNYLDDETEKRGNTRGSDGAITIHKPNSSPDEGDNGGHGDRAGDGGSEDPDDSSDGDDSGEKEWADREEKEANEFYENPRCFWGAEESNGKKDFLPSRMHQPCAGCFGAPPFNPGPSGSGSMFPGPPTMANGSKVLKHMGVSCDAETPSINPNLNKFTGIPNLSTGNNSSQPYPIQYLSLPPQLLQHDTMGCQYYYRAAEEPQANLLLQSQKIQAELFRLYLEANQEIHEKSQEIGKLTAEVLHGKNALMESERLFNIRGALGRIVYQAELMKKITTDSEYEVQAGLNELSKTPEFIQILQEEVTASRLQLEAVTACIPSIYYEASKRAIWNDIIITVYEGDHTAEQRAVLVAFLRMQRRWPFGLEWREGRKQGETKH
ncbi:hypothetical protein B9Z19DRAFT_1134546 [Tuber borchii]|uniref:Uncharacterized protein n=1 Tax=Tuber borchii TaxID=42251 RepID=A0A2T6ZE04_TUBBO|nr:hypothetical protein B9Z19DRAFT_1134546 [Tuber borchii]